MRVITWKNWIIHIGEEPEDFMVDMSPHKEAVHLEIAIKRVSRDVHWHYNSKKAGLGFINSPGFNQPGRYHCCE